MSESEEATVDDAACNIPPAEAAPEAPAEAAPEAPAEAAPEAPAEAAPEAPAEAAPEVACPVSSTEDADREVPREQYVVAEQDAVIVRLTELFERLNGLSGSVNEKMADALGTVTAHVETKLKEIPTKLEHKIDSVIDTIVKEITSKVDEMVSNVDKNVGELAEKMTKSMDIKMDEIVNEVENQLEASVAKTTGAVQQHLASCCVIN